MRFPAKTLLACLTLGAGIAFAAEATDPTVKARQQLMDTIAMNTKVLGDMAGGKAAFDAAAADAAKTALAAAAADIATAFEPQASDPKSTAKPDIWANWDDYTKKAEALATAAAALDPASVEGVQAGMAAIGGACKDCHSTYRAPS
ncbi:MAG: hypothetical protein RIT14_2343 [Pseudomonadota bacterium]|jgi:cytochrome c556